MNVTHDMSVLSLITGASVLVQLVMLGLLLCSVFSWYYIFLKVFTFKRAAKQSDKFEKDFWSGGDLNELFQRAVNSRDASGTMERLFESGFREFAKLRKQPGQGSAQNIAVVMDGTRCAMRATKTARNGRTESHLSFPVSRLRVLRRGCSAPFGHHEFVPRSPRWHRQHWHRRARHRRSADRDRKGLFAAILQWSHKLLAEDLNRLATRFIVHGEFSNILQRQS
jgi:biopolymer transport protein TolQ